MANIPIQFDMSGIEQAILARARELAATLKCLVLFVDGEYYGPVDFPRSSEIFPGDVWTFPGYGRIQVVRALYDQVHCTRKIQEDVAREQPVPPPPSPTTFDPRKLLKPRESATSCGRQSARPAASSAVLEG